MLTSQQQRALAYIAHYTAQHGGVSPTYREIAEHVGIRSGSRSQELVTALVDRGFIRRRRRCARSIEVIRRPGQRTDYALKHATDDELMTEIRRRWPDLSDRLGLADPRAASTGGASGVPCVGAGELNFRASPRQVLADASENDADVQHFETSVGAQGQPAIDGVRSAGEVVRDSGEVIRVFG